jgi:REP element-mobilizing transposase RayT
MFTRPQEVGNVEDQLAPELKESLRGRWEPVYRSQLHYLITWGTRGRRPVLRERHVQVVRGLIARTCEERGFPLLETAAAMDRVHVLMGLRPTQSVASAVRELKGRTGIELLTRFPELRVWLRGNLTWDERYSVETVSPSRLDRVRERLRSLHGPPEILAEAS